MSVQIPSDAIAAELLAAESRRDGRSKAALIRDAVQERYGRHETEDPLDDWVGSIDAQPADIDAVVYGG